MSGRRYREKWDFRDCNMYERTNSSMDQVLMTGTTKRRRRYRAIDKPLRASTAKMNHAVICERITLNRRYTCWQYCYHDNNKFRSRKYDRRLPDLRSNVKVHFGKASLRTVTSSKIYAPPAFEILSQMMVRLQWFKSISR